MQQDERPPTPVSLEVEVDAVDLGVPAGAFRLCSPIAGHGHAPCVKERSGSGNRDSPFARNSSVRRESLMGYAFAWGAARGNVVINGPEAISSMTGHARSI